MAIINVELRMMIAERLANDNYREEIKEVKESLRLHLLAYFKQINGIIYEITYDTPPDE